MGEVTGRPRVAVAWSRGGDRSVLESLTACLRSIGCDPAGIEVVRSCRRCGGDDHGQPRLRRRGADLPQGISISRSAGVLAVAVSDGAPVGVDIESPENARFDGFDQVALHPDELRPRTIRQRAIVWTRKEAYLKALGLGLDMPPDRVRASAPDGPPRILDGVPGAGDVQLADLEVPPPLVGCVAVVSAAPPRVTCVEAAAAAPARPARP
ncbi:4'-phosphopantetheinyl transferase superfamily protein [Nocardioides guangzhouensis]|uniref:4'-phosphopantetheinyl transferase superfamily protein n=1 Tax=Nocardioides guangzhouensis TaxID=2497878 RepID=A0A4Q4ZM01_9ACTN|nr:4'-phosphopantetheinyl transferase superfamily protein [Nocardioides guangzhouensis]RYP88641.1 4'-phosphopantetheinyl transferase superfamily protein [Nocardioides guangzhouensis]